MKAACLIVLVPLALMAGQATISCSRAEEGPEETGAAATESSESMASTTRKELAGSLSTALESQDESKLAEAVKSAVVAAIEQGVQEDTNADATSDADLDGLLNAWLNEHSVVDLPPVGSDPVVPEQLQAPDPDADTTYQIDPDKADAEGMTALHVAARNGQREILNLLVWQVRDVNAVDKQGRSALHYAAERGDRECVLTLLLAKASAELKDNKGATAATLAKDAELRRILKRAAVSPLR